MGRRFRAYRISVTVGVTAAMVLALAGPANAAVTETIVFNNPSVDNGEQIQDVVDGVINAIAAKRVCCRFG